MCGLWDLSSLKKYFHLDSTTSLHPVDNLRWWEGFRWEDWPVSPDVQSQEPLCDGTTPRESVLFKNTYIGVFLVDVGDLETVPFGQRKRSLPSLEEWDFRFIGVLVKSWDLRLWPLCKGPPNGDTDSPLWDGFEVWPLREANDGMGTLRSKGKVPLSTQHNTVHFMWPDLPLSDWRHNTWPTHSNPFGVLGKSET